MLTSLSVESSLIEYLIRDNKYSDRVILQDSRSPQTHSETPNSGSHLHYTDLNCRTNEYPEFHQILHAVTCNLYHQDKQTLGQPKQAIPDFADSIAHRSGDWSFNSIDVLICTNVLIDVLISI